MISIIIPTYNRAKFLPRAINSVLRQTYRDWELIIVDDGSTDNTKEVVQPYLEDKRIQYYYKKNSGAAASRNFGVNKAKFKWITFLDSDDEAKHNWLSSYIKIINNGNDIVLCSSGAEIIDETGKIIDVKKPSTFKFIIDENKYKITNGGTFILKKEIFNNIGGYDGQLKANQHTELAIRLISYIKENNLKVNYTEKNLIKIHIHKGERIRNNWKSVYQGTKQIIDKHRKLMLDNPKELSNYYASLAYAAYRIKKRKKEILKYLLIAIIHNPNNLKNYLRLVKYAL